MLLAGFFAPMALDRRGTLAFLGDRGLRGGAVLVLFMTLHNAAAGHDCDRVELTRQSQRFERKKKLIPQSYSFF